MKIGKPFRRILLLSFFVLIGCADHTSQPVNEKSNEKITSQRYHTYELERCQPINSDGMVKKVDSFAIIFDPSASMTETYEASKDCASCHTEYTDKSYAIDHSVNYGGREYEKIEGKEYSSRCDECHQDYLFSKFDFAKQLTKCFNDSIPDLELVSILRTFGYPVYSRLGNGPEKYNKRSFDRSLRKIFDADGASPLALTLDAVGKDLFKQTGKKAVIVISDGEDMSEKEILAAEDLKARYENDICIYTIHIGNDASGQKTMTKIATAGDCGLSVNGNNLLARAKMEDLVREIFLEKDSDGDGVSDLNDDCPGTVPGLEVDENGCWKLVVLNNVLFDFDKYDLKPEGINVLNQVVDLLNKHKFLDLHISGHTDNYGSVDYNIALSKQRAESGQNYLIQKGIQADRLTTSWHSFKIPVASNTTDEGRAQNRRLEFKFTKRTDN